MAVVVAGPATAAQATTNLAAEVTAGINAVRTQHGFAALPVFPTSDQVQRAHDHFLATGQMHGLFAESASFYFDHGASDFAEVQSYVEGAGCSTDALVQEWVKSEYHRDLILTPNATHLVVAATCDGAVARASGQVITAPALLAEDEPKSTQDDPDSDTQVDELAPGADDTTTPSTDPTGDTSAPVAGDTSAPVVGDTSAPVAGDTSAPVAGDTSAPVAGDDHELYRLADRDVADRASTPTGDSANRQFAAGDETMTGGAASVMMPVAGSARSEAGWPPQYPAAVVLTAGSLPLGLVLVSRRRRR